MDDLDNILTPTPIRPDTRRRDAVWRLTVGVQRRRRWLRRARTVALLVACYAAGVATLWWRDRPAPEHDRPVEVPPPQAAPPSPLLVPPSDEENDPYRNDPPQTVERWAALAEGRRRVDLYRRAGDLYYERLGDHVAAIRCYRRALDSGTAADLAVQADKDNWLLMSLKVARQKERRNVRN